MAYKLYYCEFCGYKSHYKSLGIFKDIIGSYKWKKKHKLTPPYCVKRKK